jgi:hypothetical protein
VIVPEGPSRTNENEMTQPWVDRWATSVAVVEVIASLASRPMNALAPSQ